MPDEGLFDIHCHIVPSVDDGAGSLEEALKILQMEYDQGVRTIICTPHFRRKMFETPLSKIREQFKVLRAAAWEMNKELRLYLGCEFHVNMEMIPSLKAHRGYSMAGSRYVLAEFSGSTEVSYIRERLYSLLSNGYKPIVAHIERYECMRKDIDFVEDMIDMGALMQVNADSLIGKEGFGAKRYCSKLLQAGDIHFVGSDCHGSKERISRIGEAYDFVCQKAGKEYAETIFKNNPQKILVDLKNRKGK